MGASVSTLMLAELLSGRSINGSGVPDLRGMDLEYCSLENHVPEILLLVLSPRRSVARGKSVPHRKFRRPGAPPPPEGH